MKKFIRALNPNDTRIIELTSAWGLIYASLACIMSNVLFLYDYHLIQYHPIQYWMIVFGALGITQLASVAFYPQAEILRVIIAWVNGTLWVWLALVTGIGQFAISDIGTILLGLTNLYAFCINALTIRKTWET